MILNRNINFNFRDGCVANGHLALYEGKASKIKKDNRGQILSYRFDKRRQVAGGQNILTNNFLSVAFNLNQVPCVIAIGNGDNGSIDPGNAPSVTDTALNAELDRGRFDCTNMVQRYNPSTGVATFDALIPFNAYSGLITEWGLFTGQPNSLAVNSKGAGLMIARRAEEFTKNPADDVLAVWTIKITLN